MGLRFLDSILALLSASLVVFAAYFIGHALSNTHATWAWIAAPAMILAGAALSWFTARRIRGYAQQRGEQLHS
jgi:hypothetical protein